MMRHVLTMATIRRLGVLGRMDMGHMGPVPDFAITISPLQKIGWRSSQFATE
jgi:hypothetical protein